MILTATMTIITLPLGPHRYDEISKLCFQWNDSIAMFACCCNDSQCLYLKMDLYVSIWIYTMYVSYDGYHVRSDTGSASHISATFSQEKPRKRENCFLSKTHILWNLICKTVEKCFHLYWSKNLGNGKQETMKNKEMKIWPRYICHRAPNRINFQQRSLFTVRFWVKTPFFFRAKSLQSKRDLADNPIFQTPRKNPPSVRNTWKQICFVIDIIDWAGTWAWNQNMVRITFTLFCCPFEGNVLPVES